MMTQMPHELVIRILALEASLHHTKNDEWALIFKTPEGLADRVIVCDTIEQVQMCVQAAEGALARLGYEDPASGQIKLNEVSYMGRLEVTGLVIYEDYSLDEVAQMARQRQLEGIRDAVHNERILLLRLTRRKHIEVRAGYMFKNCRVEWMGVVERSGAITIHDTSIELNPDTVWQIPIDQQFA